MSQDKTEKPIDTYEAIFRGKRTYQAIKKMFKIYMALPATFLAIERKTQLKSATVADKLNILVHKEKMSIPAVKKYKKFIPELGKEFTLYGRNPEFEKYMENGYFGPQEVTPDMKSKFEVTTLEEYHFMVKIMMLRKKVLRDITPSKHGQQKRIRKSQYEFAQDAEEKIRTK